MDDLVDVDHAQLDSDTARRLLDDLDPDDAPPGYAKVALVLRRAARITEDEPMAGSVAFAAWYDRTHPELDKWPAATPSRWSFKTVVAVLGGMFLLTSGIAAAGALPAPAQQVAAAAFETVGIDIPSGDSADPPATAEQEPEPATDTAADDSSQGKGSDISSLATTTDATGVDKGAEISTEASGGKSHAGEAPGLETKPESTGPPSSDERGKSGVMKP